MCGIAGILNLDDAPPIDPVELDRMAAFLAHRGPDHRGTWHDPKSSIGLAHARLSIIDLATGQQPLCNEDRTLWITYNGECYNFQALRSALQSAGHTFKTKSDTEVIVHLYEQYGQNCVDHIRGMFAFAIWDSTKQELFLARDRMGQKPLYYAEHNHRFIFASEPKAIIQTHNFPRTPDHDVITQYLLLGYIQPPQTAYLDIQQLPPAHTLTIKPNARKRITPKRYWAVPTEPTFQGTIDQAADQLRRELQEATRLRLISDVPLGAFLSGGIDSTVITGLMAHLTSQPVVTTAIGFEEGLYNELDYARQASEFFSTDHHEHIVRADCIPTIEKLSDFYDEPFADSSALPTFHLSSVTRQNVTVALTGDGGDECFGGYDRYKALRPAEMIYRNPALKFLAQRNFWNKITSGEYKARLRTLKRFMTAAALPIAQRYLKWTAIFDPDLLGNILTNPINSAQLWNHLAPHFIQNDTSANNHHRHLHQAMHSDLCNYLPNDLNTKIDRASMAHGLELRCPFEDHKVVELACSLPPAWRHSGKISKLILRKAAADLIPPAIKGLSIYLVPKILYFIFKYDILSSIPIN